MSETARKEGLAGSDERRRRKTNKLIFTIHQDADTGDQTPIFKKVETALFAEGAKTENQKNDVRIVCEANKYCAILVTNDGGSKRQPDGILGNRDKLRDVVEIMSPSEAVTHVRKKIIERDESNRRVGREFGGELPNWTGQD